MSPVFGIGINLAIQDAVAAANVLAGPLLAGEAPVSLLRAIQRRRMIPTVITQLAQRLVQERLIRPALNGSARSPRLPVSPAEVPVLRTLTARSIAFGVLPEHVRTPVTVRPPAADPAAGNPREPAAPPPGPGQRVTALSHDRPVPSAPHAEGGRPRAGYRRSGSPSHEVDNGSAIREWCNSLSM